GFDDHYRLGVDGGYVGDHGFDGLGVEAVGLGVVIRWGGDDDVVGAPIGLCLVGGGGEVEGFAGQVVLNVVIDDGGLPGIDLRHPLGVDVIGYHLVVLGQEDGVGEAHVAQAGYGNFHNNKMSVGLTAKTLADVR